MRIAVITYFLTTFFSYYRGWHMLAKLTSKNQLTLPKKIIADFPGVEYFEVERTEDGIMLTPARLLKIERIRAKIAALGVTEADVRDAVTWARRRTE